LVQLGGERLYSDVLKPFVSEPPNLNNT